MESPEIGSSRVPARKRVNGRDHRVKNRASAQNAKPRKVNITKSGFYSRELLRASLDLRTNAGKWDAERQAGVLAHLGGDATVLERELIHQESRLAIMARIAWAEIARTSALSQDGLSASAEAYLRIVREQRSVIQALGTQRRTQPVADLQTYLSSARAEQS